MKFIFSCSNRYLTRSHIRLFYKPTNNEVFDDFPKISDHFPKISEDFENVVR